MSWIRKPESPIKYDSTQDSAEEPWRSKAAAAWILAHKLQDARFEKYALSQLIQTCAFAAFGPWEDIERQSHCKSPIRRFSDHWVAWNCHLAGTRNNEFSGLQAARQADSVTKETRDPRIYDLEHWYSPCGDQIHPGCSHDPITREAKLQQPNLRIVHHPVRGGRSFEAQRRGPARQINTTSSINTNSVNTYQTIQTPHHVPHVSRYAPVPRYEQTSSPNTMNPNAHPDWSDDCVECGSTRSTVGKTVLSVSIPNQKPQSTYSNFKLLFGAQIAVILALSALLLGKFGDGIRHTTRAYGMFVGCVGGLTVFYPPAFSAYVFFGFPGGIASALDAKSCWSVSSHSWKMHC